MLAKSGDGGDWRWGGSRLRGRSGWIFGHVFPWWPGMCGLAGLFRIARVGGVRGFRLL
jgi:hypothetical protein